VPGLLIAGIVFWTVFAAELKADAAGFWAVAIGSVLALWAVVAPAIVGGRGLVRILPMRWVARLAALVMVVMAGFTLAEAIR
jgi:Ca2+/H+ antiporter, TMEM165/GDT1 family